MGAIASSPNPAQKLISVEIARWGALLQVHCQAALGMRSMFAVLAN